MLIILTATITVHPSLVVLLLLIYEKNSTSTAVTSTITSATSTTNTNITSAPQSLPQWHGLLVGLGGGSLPMCLQHFPDTYFTIVELEAIATEFFGFEKLSSGKGNGKTEVIVQDGVEFIANYASQLKMNNNSNSLGRSNNNNGMVDADISKSLQSLSVAVQDNQNLIPNKIVFLGNGRITLLLNISFS